MKKNEDAAAKKKPKTSAAQIRVQKGVSSARWTPLSFINNVYPIDLTELDLPNTMKTHFPDSTDLLNFTLSITPDEGASSTTHASIRRSLIFCDILQECTRVANSISRSPLTPIIPTTPQRSSARKL